MIIKESIIKFKNNFKPINAETQEIVLIKFRPVEYIYTKK